MKLVSLVSAAALVVASVGCGAGLPDEPVPPPPFEPVGEAVPPGDEPEGWFDFWLGAWDVRNVQLRDDATWAEAGSARAEIASVAGGSAILERWDGTLDETRLRGQSLRSWDPALQRWDIRLYWHGGDPGSFYTMEGERDGDALRQYPPDDRTSIRYTFRDAHEGSAVWEEARTRTDGEIWIPTWIMEFSRSGPRLEYDASNAPIATDAPGIEGRLTSLDPLVGAWRGAASFRAQDGSWEQGRALARVGLGGGGYGVLAYLDTSTGERTLTAVNHDVREEGLVGLRATSDHPGLRRYDGEVREGDGETELILTSDARRERWTCRGDDGTCELVREVAGAAAGEWDAVVTATLERLPGESAWIDVPNARMPLAGVLTGGQPSVAQLEAAAREGYRTVVNLRTPGERGEISEQAELLERLGLDSVAIPVAGADGLTDENVRRLAAVLDDADALPALVHCASGNRVGALLALDARADGDSPEAALALGLAAGLTRLEPAVRERLGLPAAPE